MPKIENTDLRRIPGIGKEMENRLIRLDYISVASLKGQNPESMYEADCRLNGGHIDRCVLYVYRLAVYFAENEKHEPEKLKWWNWKN
ncbi:MAG: helix-hairpin-helix domain-containing protein [Desulfovibrio sp.]|jgi:hypothetical protein|nr:helix-hairpin-helix domain-containing protein [Desulfovibrio sp.]